MVNTKLVMELEKLFKQEPFTYENEKFTITASFGSIEVELNDPCEEYVEVLEHSNSELSEENRKLLETNGDLKDAVEYYKDLLEDNAVEYNEWEY